VPKRQARSKGGALPYHSGFALAIDESCNFWGGIICHEHLCTIGAAREERMKPSSKRPPSTPTPIQNEITPMLHQQIRRRAFELFEQRGQEGGHELGRLASSGRGTDTTGNENDCRMMSPSGRTNDARAEQSRTFQGDASRTTTKKRLILNALKRGPPVIESYL
jgi:hypothetical protein